MKNRLKKLRAALRAKKPQIGTWLQLPSPDVAEIIGRMGYAWAAVDMEHGAFSRCLLPDMFRALELNGVVPFARVAEAAMTPIKEALDSGARGIILPMIRTRAQLDAAINHALYPGGREYTHGCRGVGFSRANAFGLDFGEHVGPEGTGQDIVIIAQIEHADAVAELDDILGHPRLDGFLVGPYDLSASMGITASFDHPDFLQALARIDEVSQKYEVAKGYHVVKPDPAALREKIEQGYSFVAYGIDALFLLESGQNPMNEKI